MWLRLPTPPAYPPPTGCRRVFIPCYGYLDADDDHRARVDRFFRIPMLVLALLVLPVLGLEYLQSREDWSYIGQDTLEHPVTRFIILAAIVFIWLAFLIEFVVKIAIAPSRLQYAMRNWLDIVIIALPMLRPLRSMRALKIVRLGQMSRMLTLRGVAMKLLRATIATIIGAEFVRRFKERFRAEQHEPPPPDYGQWSRAALIAEINRLTAENSALRAAQEADAPVRQASQEGRVETTGPAPRKQPSDGDTA